MPEKKAVLTVRLEEALIHDFKKMCEEREVVMSKVIRRVMYQELEKYTAWYDSQKGAKNGG